MSYPDLGCFAECLVCELCDGVDGPGIVPPAIPDDFYDRMLPDWADPDWGPPPTPDPYDPDRTPGIDIGRF